MRRIFWVIAIASFGGLSCATVSRNERATVYILSEPAGASVIDNGVVVGQTPMIHHVSRSDPNEVTLALEGYTGGLCAFRRAMDPKWVLVDLLLLVPLIVDGATGAWFDVAPSACFVPLQRVEAKAGGTLPAAPSEPEAPGPIPASDERTPSL